MGNKANQPPRLPNSKFVYEESIQLLSGHAFHEPGFLHVLQSRDKFTLAEEE